LSALGRWSRGIVVWFGPVLILLLLIIFGFVYWVINTSAGTRWAVVTAVDQVDGLAKDVTGTIWDGMSVGSLTISLPDLDVAVDDLVLQADWRELLNRRLHVKVLTASSLSVDLHGSDEPESSEPFSMPGLPVSVALDHFHLDKLQISQDGQPIPVNVGNLGAALALNNDGGQLVLRSASVEYETIRADLDGELELESLATPWPMLADVNVMATGLTEDSPLCARKYVPTLPGKKPTKEAAAVETATAEIEAAGIPLPGDACDLRLVLNAQGDLNQMQVKLNGQGQGMDVKLDAALAPTAAIPLKNAEFDILLADESSLRGALTWKPGEAGQDNVVSGTVQAQRFDIGSLVGPVIPPAVISMDATFAAHLNAAFMPSAAEIDLSIQPGSSWNRQEFKGTLKTSLSHVVSRAAPKAQASDTSASVGIAQPNQAQSSAGDQDGRAPGGTIGIEGLRLDRMDMDLHLGSNHLQTKGSFGASDSRLALDIMAPDLAAFWPDLLGGAQVKGELAGSISQHLAQLTAQYAPEPVDNSDSPFTQPVKAELAMNGAWGVDPAHPEAAPSWRGVFKTLAVEQGDLGVRATQAVTVKLAPQATAPAWQWELGRTGLDVLLKGDTIVALQHELSRGRDANWETQGAISRLALTPELFATVKTLTATEEEQAEQERGGVKMRNEPNPTEGIVLGLDWRLQFAGALGGQVRARRLGGDLMIPSNPPAPLGLSDADLEINLVPQNGSVSQVEARLAVRTEKMGQADISAQTRLHGFALDERDPLNLDVQADIQDLGWTSLFLDDSMELGGAVRASIQAERHSDGSWRTSGGINGDKLRFLRLDDGIRLLDGTLTARFDDDRLILEALSFPAVLRVTPQEWRTAEWVSSNPDAQDGKLTVSGEWFLFDSRGNLNIELFRYPILQRSDRYAMMSGKLDIAATLPSVSIKGQVTADAGWVNLDMIGSVPTVDGDVVVIRGGKAPQENAAPMDLALDVLVDLGPRFYLTGYGVNSGLVGQLRVVMAAGRLTGLGALRTRGGAIETYGQRLQLRRGTVTFQGDITNPVLDIEALRTGLAVEAGVKVAGTAKRPRIDLVSYPAVSELEKLSWLLLGHGPDDSGGDMALLFSVGTSFLGSGEPFYRKFGLDEVSMRSGELGSAGSVLPPESVVRDLDSSTSDIENRFIMASKRFENGITLSAQQALSDTGTVGRASYLLARGLTAELTAGTVNGLALIYRWFSRD
jgi:translocation and assembly module TamB